MKNTDLTDKLLKCNAPLTDEPGITCDNSDVSGNVVPANNKANQLDLLVSGATCVPCNPNIVDGTPPLNCWDNPCFIQCKQCKDNSSGVILYYKLIVSYNPHGRVVYDNLPAGSTYVVANINGRACIYQLA